MFEKALIHYNAPGGYPLTRARLSALTRWWRGAPEGATSRGAGDVGRFVHWIGYRDYYTQTDRLLRSMDEVR
ncbi:MAG: hypothetical protein AB2705_20980 [Candidatus Thiodiazotropha sp.]